MEYVLIRQSLFVQINRSDELSVVNCMDYLVPITIRTAYKHETSNVYQCLYRSLTYTFHLKELFVHVLSPQILRYHILLQVVTNLKVIQK